MSASLEHDRQLRVDSSRYEKVRTRPLCDIDWSELHARKPSSGDVNSVQRPVIAVRARGRDQRGQTLDQLQGCQPQLGTPTGLRLVEAIDERILAKLLPNVLRSSLECGFEHRIGPLSLSEVLIE